MTDPLHQPATAPGDLGWERRTIPKDRLTADNIQNPKFPALLAERDAAFDELKELMISVKGRDMTAEETDIHIAIIRRISVIDAGRTGHGWSVLTDDDKAWLAERGVTHA